MRTVGHLVMWAALAAALGAGGSYAARALAFPEDEQAQARSAAILAAGLLVSGILLVSATGRYWFFRANRGLHRRRHRRHRS